MSTLPNPNGPPAGLIAGWNRRMKITDVYETWIHTHFVTDGQKLPTERVREIERGLTPLLRELGIVFGIHFERERFDPGIRIVLECRPSAPELARIRQHLAEVVRAVPIRPPVSRRTRRDAMKGAPLLVLLALTGCATQNAAPPASKESSTMPTSLAPCPSSPNCVSSEATDAKHRIAPLAYSGDPAAAMARLRAVIEAMPRARVVSANDQALHAEFTSLLFRFVDDVDCVADPAAGVIQIRSASRTGYGDFGVNRKRVEQIRAAFEAPTGA